MELSVSFFFLSGRQDSNLRSPVPKTGAVTGLGHAPSSKARAKILQIIACAMKATEISL